MRIVCAGVASVGMAFALMGCSSSGTQGTPTASTSPSPATAAGAAGAVPACVIGTWTSTSATSAGASGGGVSGSLSGGQGVRLTIGKDGATKVDFTSMQPMTFAVNTNVGNAKGEYSYSGTASGTLQFPAGGTQASAQSTDGGSAPGGTGTWQPTGDVRWDGLRLTLRLTQPINQTLLDNAQIGNVTSAQTNQAGNATDLQPVLRTGVYTCQGGTLTVRPQASAAAASWTFERG